jgi:hypothetical protein
MHEQTYDSVPPLVLSILEAYFQSIAHSHTEYYCCHLVSIKSARILIFTNLHVLMCTFPGFAGPRTLSSSLTAKEVMACNDILHHRVDDRTITAAFIEHCVPLNSICRLDIADTLVRVIYVHPRLPHATLALSTGGGVGDPTVLLHMIDLFGIDVSVFPTLFSMLGPSRIRLVGAFLKQHVPHRSYAGFFRRRDIEKKHDQGQVGAIAPEKFAVAQI